MPETPENLPNETQARAGLADFGRITGTTDGLQQVEKERLLDLFLHELQIIVDQFGKRLLIRVGGFIRKVFNKLFG